MKTMIVAIMLLLSQEIKADNSIVKIIERKAMKYGIDPKLAVSIAMTESSLNPNAVGSLGEIGLFQLRPEFHDVKQGDIKHNVELAMRYLSYVKNRCLRRYDVAWFVCFNTGPNRKKLIERPQEFSYYKKVMIAYEGR